MSRPAGFIAGIYNYCDRWCQKCPLTARCLLHAEQARERAAAGVDPDDPNSVLQYLRRQLGMALQMLRREAQKHGLHPAALTAPVAPLCRLPNRLAFPHADRDRTTVEGRYDPLVLAAHVYIAIVDTWFEDETTWLHERGAIVRTGPGAVSAAVLPGASAAAPDLWDAIGTILWDRTLVPAKLARAASAETPGEGLPADADGSAKVALLSIDRSLAAWSLVRRHRGTRADTVLPILAHLAGLCRDTEARFPGARRFRRPGFDDPRVAHVAAGRRQDRGAAREPG